MDMTMEYKERRERVFSLLQAGYSRQMIADSLYVSLATCKRSIAEIYREYGVHTRAQLMGALRADI